MLRKTLKVFLIILGIGFVSAFFRGYSALYDNKKQVQNPTIQEKQEMIEQDTINDILDIDTETSKKKQ